ncbi:MAG: hypothetical protein NTV49_05670, partial [Kiritimatiellaeota bacterium]|nr:hypothetical protein [Kiritimatiellota bacterium]
IYALTLGASGITVTTGAVSLGSTTTKGRVQITLNGAQAWTNNSASALTIQNAVSNGTNLLSIGGTGNTIINGVLGGGDGGITKNGAGTLELGDGGASGSVAGSIVNNAGLTFNKSGSYSTTNAVTGSGTLTVAGGGTNTWSGNATQSGLALQGATTRLKVTAGSFAVTNATRTGLADLRDGKLEIAGVTMMVDMLRATNTAQQIFHNAGVLVLNTNSTVTAAYTVGDGTPHDAELRLAGGTNATNTFSGGLIVSNNASLTGSGTIAGGTTLVHGVLSPGFATNAAPFDMVFNAPLTLAGQTIMEIYGANDYDRIFTGGNKLTVGGALNVAFTNFTPSVGQTFTLFTASDITGQFVTTNVTGLATGQATAFNNGVLTVIPEPGTLALLICLGPALALRLLLRRRRALRLN